MKEYVNLQTKEKGVGLTLVPSSSSDNINEDIGVDDGINELFTFVFSFIL